jgi:hypothetical protein
MKRCFTLTSASIMMGLLPVALVPSVSYAAAVYCEPIVVTDTDHAFCAVMNYGSDRENVRIRMYDGTTGDVVEDSGLIVVPMNQERGVHHDVIPPGGGVAPPHPVGCKVNRVRPSNMRVVIGRYPDSAPFTGDTVSLEGGEIVACRTVR